MSTQVAQITDFSQASFEEIEALNESFNREIEENDRKTEAVKRQIEEGRTNRKNVMELHQQLRVLESDRRRFVEELKFLAPALMDARTWSVIQREENARARYLKLAEQVDPLAAHLFQLLNQAYIKLCELRRIQTEMDNTSREAGVLAVSIEHVQVPAVLVENHLRQALELIENANFRPSTSTYPTLDRAGLKIGHDRLFQFDGRKDIER